MNYFYYQKNIYFLDQSIEKTFYLSLKPEALLAALAHGEQSCRSAINLIRQDSQNLKTRGENESRDALRNVKQA